MQSSLDRRVLRTKKSIYEAFVSLMNEQPYDTITVKLLSERAGINRKTFYTHYDSLDDFVNQIELELFEQYEPLLSTLRFGDKEFDSYTFFRKLTTLITSDTETFRLLQRCFGLGRFADDVQNFLLELFKEQMGTKALQDARMQLFFGYTTSGILSVFTNWIKDPTMPINEFISTLQRLVLSGYKAVKEELELD